MFREGNQMKRIQGWKAVLVLLLCAACNPEPPAPPEAPKGPVESQSAEVKKGIPEAAPAPEQPKSPGEKEAPAETSRPPAEPGREAAADAGTTGTAAAGTAGAGQATGTAAAGTAGAGQATGTAAAGTAGAGQATGTAAALTAADLGPAGTGVLRAVDEKGGAVEFPLRHTKVEADVSGMLAGVWVTQQFTNPVDHPIEAVYVFPLPQMAAVDDMEMEIGKRTIRGLMKEREEARQIYEEAKAAGKTASLLEQERPNIFTQSVANILPGDDIRIRIHYVEDMRYQDDGYEFVFPMVVGPRYIPGVATGAGGTGWAHYTNRVPDASRITPPVLKPGERSGHDIEVTLTIAAGTPVTDVTSPSHDVGSRQLEDGRTQVTLSPLDTIPNKDLVVRYRTAGEEFQVAPLFHAAEAGRYFMLVFQPEATPRAEDIVPREMVFVLDCSGSMSGLPIGKSKEAAGKLIRSMRPTDSFQIITFSNAAAGFAEAPMPATPENIEKGVAFLSDLSGEGGTEMMAGIRASLDYPQDPKRIRIVAFMTDGYIGNEGEILAAVEEKLGGARLFSFGIGSSVNRHLLDRLAEVGRGYVTYVRQDESPDQAVERFYRRLEAPLLADIDVQAAEGARTYQVYPSPIPDLFDGQPLIVHGRYEGAGPGAIVVTGRRGSGAFRKELAVQWPDNEPSNAVLATLWARTRIAYLTGCMEDLEDPDIVGRIKEIAIRHRIMSKWTSFVAVEEKPRVDGTGAPEVIPVPVPMPDGTRYDGVFGKGDALEGGAPPGGAVLSALSPSPGAASAELISGPTKKLEAVRAQDKAATKEMKQVSVKLDGGKNFRGGKIDAATLSRYLRARSSAFQRCYSMVLRRNPDLGGKLVLHVRIDLSGRGKATVLSDHVGDPLVAKCVVDRMAGWSFPKPDGKPVEFTLPFVFGRDGDWADYQDEEKPPEQRVCQVRRQTMVVLDGPIGGKAVGEAIDRAHADVLKLLAKMWAVKGSKLEGEAISVPGFLTVSPKGIARFEPAFKGFLPALTDNARKMAETYIAGVNKALAAAPFPAWAEPTVVKLIVWAQCW
jgi:Ca-activated chloride channel family protein